MPTSRHSAALCRTDGRAIEEDVSWRRIDSDWLGVSADLAMQLDSRTNNTSLALAFEFTDTGRVLLFIFGPMPRSATG
jgi:hypothetical protein